MKKWLSIILAVLMLLSMTALAESTTEGTQAAADSAEGAETEVFVPVASVHYNMELGYTITYTGSQFVYERWYGHDKFIAEEDTSASMLISGTAAQPQGIDSLLAEAVGGYGADAVIGEPTEKMLEGELRGHSGMMLKSIEVQLDGISTRFYLMYKPTEETDVEIDVLCITATFPTDKAEQYGTAFDAMAEGIVFGIPEAQYVGEGWLLWYPSALVKPQQIYGKDGFAAADETETDVSMIVTLSDIAPEQAPDLLTEAMGGYVGYHAATEQEEKITDSGMVVRWFETEQYGTITRYYALWAQELLNDDVYCITASYPVEHSELYSSVFDSMVNSFILEEMAPVVDETTAE